MTVLSVPEMHCENCVKRINEAFGKEDLKYEVSLADKTVSVEGCEGCVKKAIEILDDLGFDAVAK